MSNCKKQSGVIMTLMLFVCCEDLWQHPSHDYLQKTKWGHHDLVVATQVLRMYVMNVFHWIFFVAM
jgi:hypothetical protein